MSSREEKKLATWRTIREAALTLFEAQGYEATTVDQIADTANVSRATFFNYFAGKEATLFDQDPGEREGWREIMDRRSAEEPFWDALSAVLVELNEGFRDRLPLQRRLKAASPALAHHAQTFGERLRTDLGTWAVGRAGEGSDELDVLLQLNLALAAMATAYQTWPHDDRFDAYMARLKICLESARPIGSVRR